MRVFPRGTLMAAILALGAALGGVAIAGDGPTPFPPANDEAAWPGKGPIRSFNWMKDNRAWFWTQREKDKGATVFVGDSLTWGWTDNGFAGMFPGRKVANRGIGGDVSRGVLFRFREDVLDLAPATIVLCIGSNDLSAHANPADIAFNIKTMLDMVKESDAGLPVALCLIPPRDHPQAPTRPGDQAKTNALLADLAKAYPNVTLIDLFTPLADAQGKPIPEFFGDDKLHLKKPAYEKWTELLQPFFARGRAGAPPPDPAKKAEAPKESEKDILTAGGENLRAKQIPAAPVRALPTADRRIDLEYFKITFADEFDGDRLNKDIWTVPPHVRQGTSRWNERNVAVHDGSLWIQIKKTTDPKIRYEAAGIRSAKDYNVDKAAFSQAFGYFECRARMPKRLDSDYWAAFWLMSGDVYKEKDADTRQGVEIDIMESFNFWNAGQSKHALHWGSYGQYHNAGGPASGHFPELKDGGMHTYGLYWDEDMYAFCVDGVVTAVTDAVGWGGTKDPNKVLSKGTSRRPAIVKVSVEAAPWCGPHWDWEKDMPAEDVFEVDYVRVYQGRLPAAQKKKLLEYSEPKPHK